MLMFRGQTLLEHARILVRSVGAQLVLVSGRPELIDGIPDLLPHCGPPGGLYAILHYIKNHQGLDGSPVLLLPVDMPLLSKATLNTLLAASAQHPCCHFDGEVFPCVMPASVELYEHLHDLFAQGTTLGGSRSMKSILRFLQAEALSVKQINASDFLNANTPQDWVRISAASTNVE